MPRINIDDELKTDIRFNDFVALCGNDYEKALGSIVRAWMIAIQYWKKDRSLIPKHVWTQQRLNQNLVLCGLVEEKEHGFYCKGSEEKFSWIFSKSENGQKGGKKSGEVRRNKINNLDQSESKLDEANQSESKPHSHTHIHSHSQYNSLTQDQELNTITSKPKNLVPRTEQFEIQVFENKKVLIKKELLQSWANTYPKEYLEESFKQARSWLLANEHKAPKSNWGRFFNSWFDRGWEKYRKTLTTKTKNSVTVEDIDKMLRGEA